MRQSTRSSCNSEYTPQSRISVRERSTVGTPANPRVIKQLSPEHAPQTSMQHGTAHFSRCRHYRYRLTRSRDPYHRGPAATFVMLNPAKADALKNDQTISKCIGFATRWGMQSLQVVNLYAYCTPYQDELFAAADPVGPYNQRWLSRALQESELIVCAWGKTAGQEQLKPFIRLVKKHNLKPMCLGTNLDGTPKHPARLAYHVHLERFSLPTPV